MLLSPFPFLSQCHLRAPFRSRTPLTPLPVSQEMGHFPPNTRKSLTTIEIPLSRPHPLCGDYSASKPSVTLLRYVSISHTHSGTTGVLCTSSQSLCSTRSTPDTQLFLPGLTGPGDNVLGPVLRFPEPHSPYLHHRLVLRLSVYVRTSVLPRSWWLT